MSTVQLVTPPSCSDEIKESIIKELTDMLAQAKRGEFSMVVVIFKRTAGKWGHYESGTLDFCEVIGRLEITKTEWINEFVRQSE